MSSRQTVQWIVAEGGERLDKYLAQALPAYSRSALQKLIADRAIRVNGAPAKPAQRVEAGDVIVGFLPTLEAEELRPEQIPLDIVYEDADLLVINKPAGMVVHPAAGHEHGTLVNAVLAHVPELAQVGGERPGIVHRLDRDTSGLIIVAKSAKALADLQNQFRQRRVEKVYLALLEGALQPPQGVVEAPIGRDPRHRQRMAVVTEGRPARTHYRVQEYLGSYTLVEARPETGRTHQIRVHLAAIGHPVVGDPIYGRRRHGLPLTRQFLHAWRLTFVLPSSGMRRTFATPLPADLQRVLQQLSA